MRLDRLSIPNYRNLRSFEIDFDELQPTTVLLGRNGSGKSNLIEAIVEIFRGLELGRPVSRTRSVRVPDHTIRIMPIQYDLAGASTSRSTASQ